MPIYEYKCKSCEDVFEKNVSRKEASQPQPCPQCEELSSRSLSSSFVLKGDGWAGKNMLLREQMAMKNRRLDSKSKERIKPTLAPNVNGERVDSWREAKKLAASKGLDTAGYDKYIRGK